MKGKIRFSVSVCDDTDVRCLTVFEGEHVASIDLTKAEIASLVRMLTDAAKTGGLADLEADLDSLVREARYREVRLRNLPQESCPEAAQSALQSPHTTYPLPQQSADTSGSVLSQGLRASPRGCIGRLWRTVQGWVLTCLGRKQNSGNVSIKKEAP